MSRASSKLFVAAAAVCGLPVVALAQPYTAPPVTINNCAPVITASAAPSPPPVLAGLPLTSTSSGIAITFVNGASKTANLVNFAVDSNGRRFIVRDVGTFSPGISIVHTYRNGAGQAFILPEFIAPNIRCHVASVRFEDGTVWRPGQSVQAPMPGPPAQALTGSALTAFPAQLVLERVTESELFIVSSRRRVAAFKETDDCAGIAAVFVAATGESSATYSVKPTATGSCSAKIADEAGDTIDYPIVVQ